MGSTHVANPLQRFHPAVASWFRNAFATPTQVQSVPGLKSQTAITLSSAVPTGSSKTLTAFLSAIDNLFRCAIDGSLTDWTSVLYVSPLKALSNDIQRNLGEPLSGIYRLLNPEKLLEGHVLPIRSLVRTGDTPSSARSAMIRRPPHILVTTPESLYLLLTAESG